MEDICAVEVCAVEFCLAADNVVGFANSGGLRDGYLYDVAWGCAEFDGARQRERYHENERYRRRDDDDAACDCHAGDIESKEKREDRKQRFTECRDVRKALMTWCCIGCFISTRL
jgi:hypothetical protein